MCTKRTIKLKKIISTEAALEKVFWKYIANLQENTHAEVQFQ